MKDYDTILFDMYGVILKESKGNFIPYTFAHFGTDEHERLKKQFQGDKLFTRAGNGEIDSDTFLLELGFKDTLFCMRDYLENYLTLDGDFTAFAEKYYSIYDFVLLSNDVSEWSKYITHYHNLDKYFKDKIVSGDVKCRKPNEEIFKIALKKIHKKPEQCLFIDNSVANLKIATNLGMKAVLFNRDDEEYDGIIVNSFHELEELILCK